LIIDGFTLSIKPAVSKLEAEGNFDQIRRILLQGSRYQNILIMSISIGLSITGKLLLLVWVGPMKADLWPLLTIMVLGYGAFYSQTVSYYVMAGLGRHVVFGLIALGIGILSILLSIAFLTYTEWNLIGVAAGSSIPLFLGSVLVLPVYTCHSLRVPIGEYLYYAVLQPIFVTLPLFLLCAAARCWGMEHPAITLMALLIGGSIIVGLCIWKIVLTDSERSMLTEMRRRHLVFFPAISQLIR
jgi:hypothetical protein